MKISIGINGFKPFDKLNKREIFCVESLHKLKNKFSNINLYLVTFEEDKIQYPKFTTLNKLKKNSIEIIQNYFKTTPLPQQYNDRQEDIKNNTRKMPIVNEIFDVLSKTDCDYFIFLNSDILLSPKFINLVFNQEYETYCVSRHDTLPIESIDQIKPFRIEIAGFDVWAIKKDWWTNNSFRFKDYIYAEHLWDVDYTLTMYNHSNCLICNKLPYAFHEKHELNWDETSLEARHNSTLWNQTPYYQNWHKFIYENLVKRPPYGQFLQPLPNEKELEEQFLKIK